MAKLVRSMQKSVMVLCLGLLAGPAFVPSVAQADPVRFTDAQNGFLEKVRGAVLKHLDAVEADAQQLSTCLDGGLCRESIAEKLPEMQKAIEFRVWQYRRLVGLYHADLIRDGHDRLVPMSALPRVRFTRAEMNEILELRKLDRKAAHDDFEKTWKARIEARDPELLDQLTERQLHVNREWEQGRDFYRLQIETILGEMPFVAYVDADRPTGKDLAKALREMAKTARERRVKLAALEGADRLDFLVFFGFVDEQLRAEPGLASVHGELLKIKAGRGVFGISKKTENIIVGSYLACAYVFTVSLAWPVGLTCGAITLGLNGARVIESWQKFRETKANWMAGLQSVRDIETAQSGLAFNAAILGVLGYPYGKLVMIAEGPLTSAVAMTVRSLQTQMLRPEAHLRGGRLFVEGMAKFIAKAYAVSLLVSPSHKDLPKLQTRLRLGSDEAVVETAPLLTYAESRRLVNELSLP